jgi:hypothetical protein
MQNSGHVSFAPCTLALLFEELQFLEAASFQEYRTLGTRACAANTHIPAPLSSLTPIDPRTLTITRAFEFCETYRSPFQKRSYSSTSIYTSIEVLT